MKCLIFLTLCLVGSQAVSFFDLVQEQWGAFKKMKLLLVFFCVFIFRCQAVSYYELVREEWESFKAAYNKHYENETEELFRMKIFMENLYSVSEHNKLYSKGLVSYKQAINEFSDLLHQEAVNMLCGYIPLNQTSQSDKEMDEEIIFLPPANVQLPDKVDWREKGAVGPVMRQGQCRSCWSFSATGSLEGQHFRKYGKLIPLSQQNLLDCSGEFGSMGCQGGHQVQAFRYVEANKGIDDESSYPYKAQVEPCNFDPNHVATTERTYVRIPYGNEDFLKVAVATVGPISAAMDADHSSFIKFGGGRVYYEPECGSTMDRLNHAILIVGYGTTENGEDYWLVKNSWGITWGDEGYAKIARNKNNHCGLATDIVYPLV